MIAKRFWLSAVLAGFAAAAVLPERVSAAGC
jgi:hypothetical protein